MRFYRWLLLLYPAHFRAEYGAELRALFSLRRREASWEPAFWLREIGDVVLNAARVHWDVLRQDLRFAARTLSRSPGFTATAVLVTALGIGANTAVFSVTDRVLIRPLPFPESDRLVQLWQKAPGYTRIELSPPNYEDWKKLARSFQSMAAYERNAANLVGQGEPQRVEGAALGGELLPLLRVEPLLGRLFLPDDEKLGGPAVVMLSYGLWQSKFGGAQDVVGRSVRLDDKSHTIVGVMPPWFAFPDTSARFWIPLRLDPNNYGGRDDNFLYAVARLGPGVTLEAARAELELISASLEREYPKENENTRANVVMLRDQASPQARLLLVALFGGAACVLLIACTNLASLLLSRALRRRRELSVRAALGAGRERLVRQLLTESLVLALAGGGLGVLLSLGLTPFLARLVPTTLPVADAAAIDLRVLAFAGLLTLATGVAFGIVPALRSCSADPDELRGGARTTLGGRRDRLRWTLVGAEVTASVALAIVAGLLMRAAWRVQAIDPGFRSEGVLTLRTALPIPRYGSVAQRHQLYSKVLSEVEALPGVSHAAYVSFLPIAMGGGIWAVEMNGVPAVRTQGHTASLRYVTPGYFATMGVPVRSGRGIDETDSGAAPYVAVVSESFVQRYWPAEDPIGRRFTFALAERTVAGVVGDVRVRGLERDSEPQVYIPHRQVRDGNTLNYVPKDLVVRSTLPPEALVPALRRIVASADPDLPISDVRLLQDVLDTATGARRAQVAVLSAFALLALSLAGLGIHGLLSYAVSQRIPEIGLRLALGAQPGSILRMVLRDGVRVAALGGVLGLLLAYGAGRSMEALLFGVGPGDLATYAGGFVLVAATVLSGCLVPALRAVRVDPTIALRAEA